MKRFLLSLLVYLLILFAVDSLCGVVANYLMSHAKGGSTEKSYYIANRMQDDIIILGSSRACHHYIPSVIEEITHHSCYNCGEEGNGSVLAYARFKMATDRYKPSIVIYELTPEYDYFLDEDNSKYLKYLKPYYSNGHVRALFDLFGQPLDRLKLCSKMYQNNSLFMVAIVDNMITRANDNGFSPLQGKMAKGDSRTRIAGEVDYKKVNLLCEMVDDCRKQNIKLVFVISPRYMSVVDEGYYDSFLDLAQEKGITIYDFREAEDIIKNDGFFHDPLHMNEAGARFFTQQYVCNMITSEL